MLILLIVITVLSGVLGQLVRLPLPSGNLYPQDALVAITVLVWLLAKLVGRDYEFKIPRYFIFICLFLFWGLITLTFGSKEVTNSEFLSGLSYFLRFVFYSLFSLVIYDLNRKEIGDGSKKSFSFSIIMRKTLIFSSLLVALAGFAQLLIYPDLSSLATEFGYDPHKNRLVSTFLDPNFTAAFLVLGLVLVLTFFSKGGGNSKGWLLLLAFIIFSALVFTFSRSGYIMFAAILLGFGVLKSPKILIFALMVMVLAYFAVPRVQTRISGITDPDDSAKLRIVSWTRAFNIFRENPIFGVGYNLYRPTQERYGFFDPSTGSGQGSGRAPGGHAGGGSDSSFLLILATTGMVGLILFLVFYVYLFTMSVNKLSHPNSLSLAILLFGLFFDSQFINSLFYPPILLWFWILVGLV